MDLMRFSRMPNVIDFIKTMTASIPKFCRLGLSDDDLVRVTLRLADFLLMSRKLVDHLRARGIQVFYWVCNTDEDFDRAFAMGKVAVVTDYPSELVAYLRRHPEIPRGTFSKSI
ncbi:unnamed protein product [Mesocestoides corti]|uniref:GP-PDE domain-containing protein n=1 Tax=Mesocestoides corti TaxID=53468 RepID=A0A0R3UM84_MESCO|nr:unnamed protein product [Mesocestoides corti]